MRNLKRNILAGVVALFSVFAHAVPGMIQYIPDNSGEYVYYSDKSFTRQSIVGFLYYDDSTYAVRYYAPADSKNKLVAKDITLYFSVDPEANHLELTGETIVGAVGGEDTDIINYLHDLFYEFTARAQKAFLESNEKIESRQDFAQFGGTVTIVFNTMVPIFNIEEIRTGDGTKVFSTITVGQLVSSDDKSFTDYKGVETAPKDLKRKFQKKSGAKSMDAKYQNQSIKLTNQWTQANMDGVWLMDDYAYLSMATVSIPDSMKNSTQLFEDMTVRMIGESTSGSYTVWKQKTVSRSKNVTVVTNLYYQPDTGDVTRDFSVLTKCADGTYAFLKLTVFDGIYMQNRSYFDGILKSYRVK